MPEPRTPIGNWALLQPGFKTFDEKCRDALCSLIATHPGSKRYQKFSMASLRGLMKPRKTPGYWNGHIWENATNGIRAFVFLRVVSDAPLAHCITMTGANWGRAMTAADAAQGLAELNTLACGLIGQGMTNLEILNDTGYPVTVTLNTQQGPQQVELQCPTDDLTLQAIWVEAVQAQRPYIIFRGQVSPEDPYIPNDFPDQVIYRWEIDPQCP
jgi:hypothetical protein